MVESKEKRSEWGLSESFCETFVNMVRDLSYEEAINRLNVELQKLSKYAEMLAKQSAELDDERMQLDRELTQLCSEWTPRHNGDSIMESEAMKEYNRKIDKICEKERHHSREAARLSEDIALISQAIGLCDHVRNQETA